MSRERIFPCQGKCDFRDDLCMICADGTDESINAWLARTEVSCRGEVIPMKTLKDAIPYMFHLTSGSYGSKDGMNHIWLSDRPWHDTEELQSVTWRYERLKKFYNKCKRNHLEFSKETFDKWNEGDEWCREYGNRAYEAMFEQLKTRKLKDIDLKLIHLPRYDQLRRDLLEFAEKEGCDLNHPKLLEYRKQLAEYSPCRYMNNYHELTDFIRSNADWEVQIKKYLRGFHEVEFNHDWVSLMYSLFDVPKDDRMFSIIKECRGSVVDRYTGEIICAPYIKFWNYGEGCADKLDWASTRVTHKRDGWFVKVFKHDGKCYVMTNGLVLSKKTTGAPVNTSVHPEYGFKTISDVILYCLICHFTDMGNIVADSSADWMEKMPDGSTMMFEMESPWNVLHTHLVDKPTLWLIGYRDENGDEMWMEDARKAFNVPYDCPASYSFATEEEMVEALKKWNVVDNGEGVVACDKDFKRIKIKCDDYRRVKFDDNLTELSDNRLFYYVINNEVDDLIAANAELQPRVDDILKNIREYKAMCAEIKESADNFLRTAEGNKKKVMGIISTCVKAPFRSLYRESLSVETADELIDDYFKRLETAPKKTAYRDMLELLEKHKGD